MIFPYYLLATTVVFFLLDLVAQRSPYRSLAWCAGSAFFVAVHPGNEAVNAIDTLVFAVLAVTAGVVEVNPPRFNRHRGDEDGPGLAHRRLSNSGPLVR